MYIESTIFWLHDLDLWLLVELWNIDGMWEDREMNFNMGVDSQVFQVTQFDSEAIFSIRLPDKVTLKKIDC